MISIIGGSGFVGSRLISELGTKNCQNLDKITSPFFKKVTTIGDIRHKEQIFLPQQTRAVVLLAAEHHDDVLPTSLYYDVNVKGTKNVLDKMDEQEIKQLIFTSSVAVYGLNKQNPDETHAVDPFNHYGKSKWEAERVIKKWYDRDPKNKSVTIIRPTVIFGERNRGNVYNLLNLISSGRFIMIGKGQNKKSMAYVGNIAAFIKHSLEKVEKEYQVLNYVDPPDFTMTELVGAIEKKMNINSLKVKIPYWAGMLGAYAFDIFSKAFRKKSSISSVRVKKFCATTQFNGSKLLCNFDPPYTIEEGLNKTLDYEFVNPKEDDVLFYSE